MRSWRATVFWGWRSFRVRTEERLWAATEPARRRLHLAYRHWILGSARRGDALWDRRQTLAARLLPTGARRRVAALGAFALAAVAVTGAVAGSGGDGDGGRPTGLTPPATAGDGRDEAEGGVLAVRQRSRRPARPAGRGRSGLRGDRSGARAAVTGARDSTAGPRPDAPGADTPGVLPPAPGGRRDTATAPAPDRAPRLPPAPGGRRNSATTPAPDPAPRQPPARGPAEPGVAPVPVPAPPTEAGPSPAPPPPEETGAGEDPGESGGGPPFVPPGHGGEPRGGPGNGPPNSDEGEDP